MGLGIVTAQVKGPCTPSIAIFDFGQVPTRETLMLAAQCLEEGSPRLASTRESSAALGRGSRCLQRPVLALGLFLRDVCEAPAQGRGLL